MMLASMLALFFPSLVPTRARSEKGWDILFGAILSYAVESSTVQEASKPTRLSTDNTYNSQEAPPDLLSKTKTIEKRMNVPPMWEQIGRHWDLISRACRYCTEWGCLIQNGMSDERMSMGQSRFVCYSEIMRTPRKSTKQCLPFNKRKESVLRQEVTVPHPYRRQESEKR
ncbi:hypothetical protein BDP27DRAFT_1370466 [Rhodocollybia butyracea]|uniref:Secreted protein n=1 Tax=Rhodocollybia butyracea TaxID=206335 RepID=A0A9P5PBX8_9AGAR|nr:hypothetical protein BDP27DRAFT_1370466 [Rhodocollybia butyracea]